MSSGSVALTDGEFASLRAVLARSAGLALDETRRGAVASCVAERLRVTGATDVASYLDLLVDRREQQELLEEVTIQETHFFRNPPQVRALRQHVLPELIEWARDRGRRIRVWSAGCSTGEEAYTVAMLLREQLPSLVGWDVQVVATDVSARALDVGRRGCYGTRAVQLAAPADLDRFFTRTGSGGYSVRPEVREIVQFRQQNLVTDPVPFGVADRLDLVLCRNVTIYFSRDTTRGLMTRLHAALRDGGYLFLGHSETLWQVSEEFRLVPLGTGAQAAFVYRRVDRAPVHRRRTVLPDRRTEEQPPAPPTDDRRVGPRRRDGRASPAPIRPRPSVAAVRAALAAGRHHDAIVLASDLLGADPLDPSAHYLRGLAKVAGGEDASAVVDLRRAVYLDPGAGLGHFLLAGALHRLADPRAAASEYRAAAQTLGSRPAEEAAPELGGRSGREVARLCAVLGRQLLDGVQR